jgi:hypothetical protein
MAVRVGFVFRFKEQVDPVAKILKVVVTDKTPVGKPIAVPSPKTELPTKVLVPLSIN